MKKVVILFMLGLLLLTGCSSNKDKIVIYSSMEEERNSALKKELKEEFPDKKIVVQYMSTGNSAAKIKNEGVNIEASIIVDLESSHAESLKDNFEVLDSKYNDLFTSDSILSNRYLPWSKETASIIIDNKYFKEHKLDTPKSYSDLLKEEYKDLIAMPDPKTSGTGYSIYLNVVNVMGEDKAIDYFKSLRSNMREFTSSGSGPTNLLKQGEVAIAFGMTSEGVKDINDGYDFSIIELDTGTPYNTTSSAIIKGKASDDVKNVFSFIIDECNRYDKENFVPGVILKDQKNNIKGYPTNLKSANMDGINDKNKKNHLIDRWSDTYE